MIYGSTKLYCSLLFKMLWLFRVSCEQLKAQVYYFVCRNKQKLVNYPEYCEVSD